MLVHELLAGREMRPVECVAADCTLLEAAETLRANDISALLITNMLEQIVGVMSERDIVRALLKFQNDIAQQTVDKIMTHNVISCSPEDDVVATLELMNEKHIRHMPVLCDHQAIAMLSIREFDFACRSLQEQARTDELTGLTNRRFFLEMANKEMGKHSRFETPVSLAMLDIDDFKTINDTHGHAAGDDVLRALSKLLVSELRTYDIVGRLGGEEFGIMFPNTPIHDARLACYRLLSVVRNLKVRTAKNSVNFTVSIGLVEAQNYSSDCTQLMKRADQLLYEAKAGGRDRLVAEPDRRAPTLITRVRKTVAKQQ
ncbi:MAG: GGDEF domain-containing protein [Pseudomonadota bacterium]